MNHHGWTSGTRENAKAAVCEISCQGAHRISGATRLDLSHATIRLGKRESLPPTAGWQLYDLEKDPREMNNVYKTNRWLECTRKCDRVSFLGRPCRGVHNACRHVGRTWIPKCWSQGGDLPKPNDHSNAQIKCYFGSC